MYLVRMDGPVPTPVRVLSADEYAAFCADCGALHEAERRFHAIGIVDSNARDFRDQIAAALQEHREHGLLLNTLNRFAFQATRRLVNFLTAMRLYLDHSETRIKRECGIDSPEWTLFRAETRAAFDGHLEYRFLYKLRNYVQHCGMPFSHLALGVEVGKSAELHLLVDPDDLLADFDGWGPVAEDLRVASGTSMRVDLMPDVVTAELKRIDTLFVARLLPALKASGHRLMDLLEDALGGTGAPAVVDRLPSVGEDAKMSVDWPPLRMLQHLGLLGLSDGPTADAS